jgi:protein-disulfide isomerase
MAEMKIQDKLLPLMVVALIAAAFALGVMWGKVQVYEKGLGTPTAGANQPAPQKVQPTLDQVQALFTDDNIAMGDADNKLLFVEFADPSCPWCHVASGKNEKLSKQMLQDRYEQYLSPEIEMRKLVDQGKASFAWFYRNGHGNGELAAKLLYCANDVGQFWPAHDLLMSSEGYDIINTVVKNDVTKLPELVAFLSSVPKIKDIEACVTSGTYDDRLAKDTALGNALGAGGTPHFIVNTTAYEGAQSYETMKSVVEAEL